MLCVCDLLNMPPIRRRTNLGRRTRNATNQINYQSNRTAQEREDRNERERIRLRQTREARHSTNNGASLNRAAFCYDMSIDYSAYNCVAIGPMNSVCQYCKALKYKNEANGLCCANGKVKLIPLLPPPEPLYSLVLGIGTDSIHFLKNIQQYNDCFQMTSFGATKVVRENFMPTFKVCNSICSCMFINHNYYSPYTFLQYIFSLYRYKVKYITEQVLCYQCQIATTSFCKFILWAILHKKSIYVVHITIQ